LPGTASAGDQAFVTASNRLYLWNGSGWYNIALINTNPTISGVSSSYGLAIDGTATTVTITATDPEGLPITYSIASDTSGNIATVTQNANVFTITPSTNTANAGSFSLTFRASDGINIASAVSEFTLQFKVVNQKYTSALITSVGTNNAVNNSFDDKSTNDHTITAAGNATQTTFSPYRHGGYSTYFDGSGDYIQPAGTTIFDISSSTASFTVEAWINPPALPSAGAANYRFGSIISKAVVYVSFGFTSNGTLRFYTYSGAENYINSASGVIEAGKWQHVALVSNAGSITLYKDGVSVATGTLVAPAAAGIGVAPKIATADTGQAADFINSYISDLRVVEGTAVYTSAFTPPTERLTAITNTTLLTCHLPYIADGSSTGHAITVNGNTKTLPFAPYDAQEYSAADHSGSMYFDGTGDYLSIADHADLDMGSSDFTIEGWYYPVVTPGGSNGLLSKRANSSEANGILIYFGGTSTGQPSLLVAQSGSWAINTASSITFKTGQWNHFAIVRNGTSFKLYMNGKAGVSVTSSITVTDNGHPLIIGTMGADGSNVLAESNISDFRVVKGTAVYTADFTPPTAPLTAVTNTSLLLQSTDAGIIDKSQSVKTITLNGDVKSSTTQSKYLTSSMYFDGAGDSLDLYGGLGKFGTGDFTIELWAYASVTPNLSYLIEARNTGSQTNTWSLSFNWIGNVNNDILQFATFNGSSATLFLTSNTAFPANTWKHIAVTRSGTTMKMFFDGTEVASNNSAGFDFTLDQNPIHIGKRFNDVNHFNGYLSDVRITKGLARYTANFTPPTAALQG